MSRREVRKAVAVEARTGSKVEALKAVNYTPESARAHTETLTNHPLYAEEKNRLQSAILAKEPKIFERLATRAIEGIDAMETKFFQFQGQVGETREVVSHDVRLKWAEFIANVFGEIKSKDDATVQVNVTQVVAMINQARQERGLDVNDR